MSSISRGRKPLITLTSEAGINQSINSLTEAAEAENSASNTVLRRLLPLKKYRKI